MITLGKAQFSYKSSEKLGEDETRFLDNFLRNEYKIFSYYFGLNNDIINTLLNVYDDCSSEHNKLNEIISLIINKLSCFYYDDLNDAFDIHYAVENYGDKDRQKIIYGRLDEIDTNAKFLGPELDFMIHSIYAYIESFNQTAMSKQIKSIKSSIDFYKEHIVVANGYNYESAFSHLDNRKDHSCLRLFVKLLLLSNDYFNDKYIYRIRKIISSSNHIDDMYRKCLSTYEPKTDLLSMFFADYKLIKFASDFSMYFKNIIYDNESYEQTKIFIMMLIYCRFILDMCILIYQCKDITAIKSADVSNSMRLENNIIPVEVALSKVYNMIDGELYQFAHSEMSISENICFLAKKICDDVCIHEQASLGRDFINRMSGFKFGNQSKKNASMRSNIINEMLEVAKNEWDNGSRLNHIQMVVMLEKHPKFKESFYKDSKTKNSNEDKPKEKNMIIRNNLIKSLKSFCRENHDYSKFIKGTDEYWQDQKRHECQKNPKK